VLEFTTGCLEEYLWEAKLFSQAGYSVRATRAEHSRRFLSLNYVIKYVTTHLQEIPQRIR